MNARKIKALGYIGLAVLAFVFLGPIVTLSLAAAGGGAYWWFGRRKISRLGIFGGKFDPPHIGHLMGAEWVREHFNLDLVLFMVSGNPPHKSTGVTEAEDRLEMTRAAVSPNKYFQACDLEIQRQGKSYMVDTLRDLRRQYGAEVELFLMVSTEYLDPSYEWHLSKWREAEEIFKMATMLVFPRVTEEGESRAEMIRQVEEWIKLLPQAKIQFLQDCPIPAISSTLVRNRRRAGESIWYLVTTEVWRKIRDRGHYLDPGQPWEKRSIFVSAWFTTVSIGRELRAFWDSVRPR